MCIGEATVGVPLRLPTSPRAMTLALLNGSRWSTAWTSPVSLQPEQRHLMAADQRCGATVRHERIERHRLAAYLTSCRHLRVPYGNRGAGDQHGTLLVVGGSTLTAFLDIYKIRVGCFRRVNE